MSRRLTDRFPIGTPVEIRFGEQDNWFLGVVVKHQHPAVWVKTADNREWFVTNGSRIRAVGMKEDTQQKLRDLNQQFYSDLAQPFAHSRQTYQPGFYPLLPWLQANGSVLDLGCGEGRLGRFLREHGRLSNYTGIDFAQPLLDHAESLMAGTYLKRDISFYNCVDDLGMFDTVACLSAMQHIPTKVARQRLLKNMVDHTQPEGRVVLGNWQFMDSERQKNKLRDWSEADILDSDVEQNDYLLTWNRGGFSYRYVCLIDEKETADLAKGAGLKVVHQYRADGKEGNLNLYTIFEKMGKKKN